MTKAIIFDFFGVFSSSMASNWFSKTAAADEKGLAAFQALCTLGDLGKLSRTDFNIKASELTGVPVPEIEKGIEAELHINNSLVAYTKELRARGLQIACLSNGSHEWTLYVINKHGLGELFDEVFLSSDLGIVKPDPRIYIHALKSLGLDSSETIFVDDRKINTDAAEHLGIPSVIFRDTPSFIKDLESLLTHGW